MKFLIGLLPAALVLNKTDTRKIPQAPEHKTYIIYINVDFHSTARSQYYTRTHVLRHGNHCVLCVGILLSQITRISYILYYIIII